MDYLGKCRLLKRIAAIAAIAVLLPSCAVLNPHVDARKLDEFYAASENKFEGNLSGAVRAADELRHNYLGAVGQYAYARNGLVLTVIPLTAWGLYRGVTSSGGATEALAVAGIGAAGGYAVGSQLLSGQRELIYLAGAEAIGCSILAMRPYLVLSVDAQNSLIEPARKLKNEIEEIEKQLAQLTDHQVKSNFTKVNAWLASKRKTLIAAYAFKGELDSAAVLLIEKARTIQSRVSTEIVKSQPDLASILTAASALPGLAGQFGGSKLAADALQRTDDSSTITTAHLLQNGLGSQIDSSKKSDIEKAMVSANEAASRIEQFLAERLALSRVVGSIDACKFAGPKSDFAVEPDIAEIELSGEQRVIFNISGGTGIPRVSVVGTASSDVSQLVTIDTRVIGGNVQVVVKRGNGDANNDDLRLVFSDGSGQQRKSIKLKLGGANTK
jgi:hypothetical protein